MAQALIAATMTLFALLRHAIMLQLVNYGSVLPIMAMMTFIKTAISWYSVRDEAFYGEDELSDDGEGNKLCRNACRMAGGRQLFFPPGGV